jgi:hypothetical protein
MWKKVGNPEFHKLKSFFGEFGAEITFRRSLTIKSFFGKTLSA